MNVLLHTMDLGEEWVLYGLDAAKVKIEKNRSDEGVAQFLIATVEGGRDLRLEGRLSYAQEEEVLSISAGKVPVMLTHPRFTGLVLIERTEFEDEFDSEMVDPLPEEKRFGSIFLLEV